jgi:hypothetical protein
MNNWSRHICALVVLAATGASGKTAARHDPRERDALDLARCIVAEAGPTPGRDAVAILHVLERRTSLPAWRHKNAADVARAYCVALNGRSRTERASRMRALGRDAIPASVMSLADAWMRGRRPSDPCRGNALHWGAPGNPEQCSLPIVSCGNTRNIFYRGPN